MARNSYTQLLRMIRIYSLFKKKKYTSKREILDKIEERYGEVSNRTIDRDIEELRNEFGLVINYKRPDGYFLDEESYQDFAKIENTFHLIDSTLFKIKYDASTDFVQSDTSLDAKGNEYLEDFFKAISKKCKVKLMYNSFVKEAYELTISPFILKEYRQRWYVAAYTEKNERRIYSLDRVEAFELLESELQDTKLDRTDMFKDLIGVSLAYNNAENVLLKFNKHAANYIKTRPLHPSQKIVKEDSESLIIGLYVIVNWELEEIIRGHGLNVSVLKPVSLRERIIGDLKNTLDQY